MASLVVVNLFNLITWTKIWGFWLLPEQLWTHYTVSEIEKMIPAKVSKSEQSIYLCCLENMTVLDWSSTGLKYEMTPSFCMHPNLMYAETNVAI